MKPRRTFKPANQDGFALIDSVIAAFVLVVGLLAMASVLVSVTSNQTESLSTTTAANLAQEKLEQLQSVSYSAIGSGTENFGQISDFADFRREVTVTANADDTLKDIDVTVTQVDGDIVRVSTRVAR
jgi:Tfp pilus assembly protein PilV